MERDSKTNSIIDDLEVFCPNTECTWKDKLKNLNKHYNSECSFTKNPEWLNQNQNYIQIEEDNVHIPLEKTFGFSLNKTAETPWLIRMEPPFGPHMQAPLVPMGFPYFMEEYYHKCPMYKVFAERKCLFFEKKNLMVFEKAGKVLNLKIKIVGLKFWAVILENFHMVEQVIFLLVMGLFVYYLTNHY